LTSSPDRDRSAAEGIPSSASGATRGVLTLVVLIVLGSLSQAHAQVALQFDLPAQSLADSLRAVAARTHSNILFDRSLVAGVEAKPLKGEATTEQALQQLLTGTDLTYRRLDEKTVTIVAAAAPGQNTGTQSDGTKPAKEESHVVSSQVHLGRAETPADSGYGHGSATRESGKGTARLTEETGGDLQAIVITGSRLAPLGFSEPTPVTVVPAEELRLSGTVNTEQLLEATPQFLGSQGNDATANTVPGGTATLNLRGFGAQRNLVLVNGRRFAISGPDETTDINTIPAALIKRIEVVTGGSSAVYGSDAITGVVNFIMRDDFEGVEVNARSGFDTHTRTPVDNFDLTAGGKFADGRGNVVVSANYLNRGSITRGQRGDWAYYQLQDGCVTPGSVSRTGPGVPVAVPAGSTCAAAGGVPGLIAGGSGDIPNGRFTGVPTVGSPGSNPALDAALTAAGLGQMGSRGFTFDNNGPTGQQNARPALSPQDDYNLGPSNYLIIPQKRWMLNAFSHLDFNDRVTGYAEFHFSNNVVAMQLAPTNVDGPFLFNINNPYLSPQMQAVLRQLDLAETGHTTVTEGTSSLVTTPGDGLAVLNVGRRLVEVGLRTNEAVRNVWREALGLRGRLGDLSANFLRNLSYDVYYTYGRTEETDHQDGNVSRSRLQAGLLSVNGAPPLIDLFGQNISAAGVSAIELGATNITRADQQVAAAGLSGEAFDVPAGPVDFSAGLEWRRVSAAYLPDSSLSSGDAVGFNPGLPTGGSVAVKEVYGELGIPILSGLPFIRKLTTNGAFRYSDYDLGGVGGVRTYSLGASWKVSSDVSFRGQYQHAVRAPNVGELYGGLSQNFAAATDPCSAGQPAAQQTAAVRAVCIATGVPASQVFSAGVQPNFIIGNQTGGNPNVGVEQSDTRTFGVVITPAAVSDLALSIDYFNINLDGAIAPLGGGLNSALNLCYNVIQDPKSPYCQAIRRNPVTGEISPPYYVTLTNANTGGLKTSGVDLEGRYGFLWGAASFELTTDWTWTHEMTSTPVQALPSVKDYCVGSFGPTCGQPIPELKGVSRLTWHDGPLSVSLRHRYIGEVSVDSYLIPKRLHEPYPALSTLVNPIIAAQSYFDLSLTWNVLDNVQLYGGLDNLFDKNPPIVGSSSPSANTFAATYDVLGRQAFVGITAKF
jgi:iron complex outermembrane recepter protein